jgi:ribokinase
MTKIAVVGSLTVDMALQTPRVPRPGDNVYGRDFRMGAGGKGANAATAVVRMGGEALMVGCLGDDYLGEFELTALQAEGIDATAVTVVPGASTDVVCVMVLDGGQNAVVAIIRTNLLLTGSAVAAALHPHWGTLDAILVNFECSESAVAEATRLGRAHSIPVVVDAGPVRDYGPEAWRSATVLSPNIQEALTLAAVEASPEPEDHTIRNVAQELLAAGPGAVVVKLGHRGALLLTEEDEVLVPAFAVEAVDTTGAGDAFTAALTLAIAKGSPLPEAVYCANAAGALATTRFGAREAMPSQAEIDAFLSKL